MENPELLTKDTGRVSPRSSVVEHFLGKEEVISSILIVGSINYFLYS